MRNSPRRLARSAAGAAVLGSAAMGASSLGGGLASASTVTPSACPSGYNLCIAPQGANEGVKATAGQTIHAGYEFTVSGSSTTKVAVFDAYEELTISCSDNSVPTRGYVDVPMPDATYTGPFSGWVPAGGQSSSATYQGSYTMPDLCHGATIDVGQPGNMMFVARVYSDSTAPISFQSHYNGSTYSCSGSWSATKSVTPDPISSSSVLPGLGSWALGGGTAVVIGAGLGTVLVMRRRRPAGASAEGV